MPAVVDAVGAAAGPADAAATRLRQRRLGGRAPLLDPVPVSVQARAAGGVKGLP